MVSLPVRNMIARLSSCTNKHAASRSRMKFTAISLMWMSCISFLMALGALTCTAVKADEVKVTAKDLYDQRMTDQFFGGGELEIMLKVTGVVVKEARSL